MTKEERIMEFNAKASSVKVFYYSSLDNYIELTSYSAFKSYEVPELIKVLTEAKQIMEAE